MCILSHIFDMETPTIICSKCNRELPHDQEHFHVRSKNPLTFRKDCKECVRIRGAKYRIENHEKVLDEKRKYREANLDKIRQKAREYNLRLEVKERHRKYMKTERGRKKQAERNKRYIAKPSVKARVVFQSKARYYADLEKSRRKLREYKKRPEVRAKTRAAYHANKTVETRVRAAIRASILYHLKRAGKTKDGSLVKYIGYPLTDLKNHLEKLWEPWMNWDNWGLYRATNWKDDDPSTWTWQIDHIKRHREFKYDSLAHPEFKECWALSNLRPLSAKENVIRQ